MIRSLRHHTRCTVRRYRTIMLALTLAAAGAPTAGAQGEPVEKPRRIREPVERTDDAAPPQPAAPLPPGKYRVTVAGFTVNRQTDDDALQLDGKGDEVFLSVAVLEPVKLGEVLQMHGRSRLIESLVIGNRNGFTNRIRAGSLSSEGGLKTGDVVRLPQPVVLWDGPITTPILVIPTIWEWDNASMDKRAIHIAWLEQMRPPGGVR